MRHNTFLRPNRGRRRGVSMLLFFLSLPVIFGITGMVIDLTNLYTRRAYAQRAADAAALAGAMKSAPDTTTASGTNDSEIIAEAKSYADLNGYSDAQVQVDPHFGGQLGKVQVTVARSEKVFFVPVLELLLGDNPLYSRRVSASAIAEKIMNVDLSLGGNYGTTTGASNPSAFGPYARHSFGDPYSVLFHDDGTPNTPANVSKNKGTGWDANTHYNPDGFTYNMTVTPDFVAKNPFMRVQLYDPDGYFSSDGQSLDEKHTSFLGSGPTMPETTTEYTIYKVQSDGSLKNVTTATYGNDSSVDAAALKAQGKSPWVTPDGFRLDLATQGAGQYKIRIKTTDGSSENGFNLRAGPDVAEPAVQPRTKAEWDQLENEWNDAYGDKGGLDPYNIKVPIQAQDHLQMNFTRTDHVRVRLGEVPQSAAGKELTVTKFDTDVGSTNIKYSFVAKGTTTVQDADGTDYLNPANDTWSQNQVKVPEGFKGGYVYAEYDAGQGDTSSWSVKVPGASPGSVKLVK